MSSVWLLHEKLQAVNNANAPYGADRADFERDLGFTSTISKFDALAAWIAWLPLTLAGEDALILQNSYLVAETPRSTTDNREYIVFPNTITLEVAMTMISPKKSV